jgi:type IV secretory pathway VirB2 component (pilin)
LSEAKKGRFKLIQKLKTLLRRPYVAAPLSLLIAAAPAFCKQVPNSAGLKSIFGWILGAVLFGAAVLAVVMIVSGFFSVRGDDYGSGLLKVGVGLVTGVLIAFAVPWVNTLTGQNINGF